MRSPNAQQSSSFFVQEAFIEGLVLLCRPLPAEVTVHRREYQLPPLAKISVCSECTLDRIHHLVRIVFVEQESVPLVHVRTIELDDSILEPARLTHDGDGSIAA